MSELLPEEKILQFHDAFNSVADRQVSYYKVSSWQQYSDRNFIILSSEVKDGFLDAVWAQLIRRNKKIVIKYFFKGAQAL